MKKYLKDVPASELEEAIDFQQRHKTGNDPAKYLDQFLRVSRQYGYATEDGSWGELEKELSIVFRELETMNRYVESEIFKRMSETGEDYENVRDLLMNQGEIFWIKEQEAKNLTKWRDRQGGKQ